MSDDFFGDDVIARETIPAPIMAFEFNETSGSTLTDTIGGRTCTLGSGIVLADLGSGRRGIDSQGGTHSGLTVSGTDIFCPNDTPWSIEAVVNLHAFTDASPGIAQFRSGVANNPFSLFVSRANNYFGLAFGSQSTFARSFTGGRPEDGEAFLQSETHVVITYNGAGRGVRGNFKAYINNVSKTLSSADAFSSMPDGTKIGTLGTNTATQWDGPFDFLRFYDVELSAAQVATAYAVR